MQAGVGLEISSVYLYYMKAFKYTSSEADNYLGWRLAVLAIILLFATCTRATAQITATPELGPHFCPTNDSCTGAIILPPCETISFCNDSCGYEFYEVSEEIDFPPGDPYMDNTAGPFDFECHYINHDQWFSFQYPPTGTGYMELSIFDGDCAHPEGATGNFGPLEGWAGLLWEGVTCDLDTELVWSTNCYWMTEAEDDPQIGPFDWMGIDEYDPTRQDWHILFTNITPGANYFLQVDSFGWCRGCGKLRWCPEPFFLNISYEQESGVEETIEMPLVEQDGKVLFPWKVTDLKGRAMRIKYNTPMIFHYRNGDNRKVVIVK